MSAFPELNFPPAALRRRPRDGRDEVWDSLRKIWLALTPEEWVRQHLIAYLISDCGAQPLRIVEEYPVSLNRQPQRADVVVAGNDGRPLILAECKAPDVEITEKTFAQAVRYNSVLGARYVILTNGLRHYCYEVCTGEYVRLQAFPNL